MKQITNSRWILVPLVLTLLLITPYLIIVAYCSTESHTSINDAATRLVQFCNDPKMGIDERDVATLVDYVRSPKQNREHALSESQGCPGAYQEFDTKISFPRFMAYSYNSLIPSAVTRPSTMRYSLWTDIRGKFQKLPSSWKLIPPSGAPLI